jgi:hypothetical protein
VVAALAIYAAVGAAADAAVKASGINPGGTGNHLPEWKLLPGLAGRGGGVEDTEAIYALWGDPSTFGQARELAQETLRRDIEQLPDNWPQILRRQSVSLWVLNDTAVFAFNPGLAEEPTYAVPDSGTAPTAYWLVAMERGFFLPAVLLAAAGVIALSRGRRWGAVAIFLACLLVAYATVHLVVEVQPRYRYAIMPAIFALGAPAWARLAGWRAASEASKRRLARANRGGRAPGAWESDPVA